MAGLSLRTSRPMSSKEIIAKAEDFNFNPFIAVKHWLRTADTLLREAQIYEDEENDQQAYLLLMRYATLVLQKLPLHPALRERENRANWKAAQENLPSVLAKLESLKARIDTRCSAWERNEEKRRTDSFELGIDGSHHSRSPLDLASSDPAVAGNTTTIAAAENSELAVKLAHKELKRRDAARKISRRAGLWDDWEVALSKDEKPDGYDMQKNMETSRRMMGTPHDIVPDGVKKKLVKPRSTAVQNGGSSEYRYPSITKSQALRYEDDSRSLSRPSSSGPAPLPPKPPKEMVGTYIRDPPTLPIKAIQESPDPSTLKPEFTSPSYTFRPSAYLENGKPLRTVFLPPTLRKEFLAHAESNTRRNLETCGMLCGTVISNALFIQRVVIPEQESTSDTCETINESAFFDYCESEDLLVLGWIHTHPTQTCFMSSRDLHTHCAYQLMMPESIAIVCAPSKNPSWGVFRLTDPPGMQSVVNCRKTGLFHPHDESNIYTDALRPGHVFEAEGMNFEVVDLRPQ